MFQQTHAGELMATCEDCEELSSPMPTQKEVAILRLIRAGWRVRTKEGITRTWCPECNAAASVPRMRAGL